MQELDVVMEPSCGMQGRDIVLSTSPTGSESSCLSFGPLVNKLYKTMGEEPFTKIKQTHFAMY